MSAQHRKLAERHLMTSGRPKAYSYLRFSTPEQKAGDSVRRQIEGSKRYARKNGLDLDTELTFEDQGVSAYRGKNIEAGELAVFLGAVDDGLVPKGSYLLIESLDRLSRLKPRKAIRVLEGIIDQGITVVTISDRKEYNEEILDDDPMALMWAYMVAIRAHEESEMKSRRGKAAWEDKRANAKDRPLTARCPAWLRLSDDRTHFEVIEERAKIVRRIFEMTLDGDGQYRIANTFNHECVPTFGRSTMWHRTYIKKIRQNPAAYGQFTPHRYVHDSEGIRTREPLEPIEGYFPAVVSKEDFDAAQSMSRGGKSRSGPNTEVRSVIAGLARCPRCNEGATTRNDGERRYIVCTGMRSRTGCDMPSVRYELVEEAIFRENGRSFALVDIPGKHAEAQKELNQLDIVRSDLRNQAAFLLDELDAADRKSSMILSKVFEIEDAARPIELRMAEIQSEIEGLTVDRWRAHVDRLLGACSKRDVKAVNEALRFLVDHIEVRSEGYIDLHLLHGEVATITIPELLLKADPVGDLQGAPSGSC